MTQRMIDAPAKINLGLEILGKRDDGFHEVRTILCTISLRDTLVFEPSRSGVDSVLFQPEDVSISDDENLVIRALDAMRDAGADIPPQQVTIHKRIPAAAGLGGASSDAAATLKLFEHELHAAGADIFSIAAELGSDVPFFLNGPIALAEGRGEVLTPLPPPDDTSWAILVTPGLEIPDKTRAMYGAVDHAWWTSGDTIRSIADGLPALPDAAPPNVFERALLRLHPDVAAIPARMLESGAPFASLTGAGPTFYMIVAEKTAADSIATRLAKAGFDPIVSEIGWTR